jgi:hypothetical protein
MRKFFGAIAALLMVLVGAPPAQAYVESVDSNCWTDDGGALYSTVKVCVGVTWRQQDDGKGVRVTDLDIYCTPEGQFEGDMQVNGYGLGIYTSGGTLKWHRGDGDSNITNNCFRDYNLDVNVINETGCLQVLYEFRTRRDFAPDKDGIVGLMACNNQ